jgi:RND family efflux transporter MFP subunit
VVKPVKLFQVPSITTSGYDAFLAEVDAGQRSQLSFQIPGVIEQLNVREGQRVKRGDVLAVLDAKDYQLAVDAAQAQYDLAKTRYKRDKLLFGKKLISADSFDRTETAYKASIANLDTARTDLAYTQIKAPFSGLVSLRFVTPYQFIGAKQPVLNIINNDQLDVNIVLPVPYVESVGIGELRQRQFAVVFDMYSAVVIPAQFKEMSTQPNPDTNSYSATLSIKRPQSLNVLKGMTGQVLIAHDRSGDGLRLPEGAWIAKTGAQGEVWRLNSETQMLERVVVTLNEFGAVVAGLNAGDNVVSAGAKGLVEGQIVRAWTRERGI